MALPDLQCCPQFGRGRAGFDVALTCRNGVVAQRWTSRPSPPAEASVAHVMTEVCPAAPHSRRRPAAARNASRHRATRAPSAATRALLSLIDQVLPFRPRVLEFEVVPDLLGYGFQVAGLPKPRPSISLIQAIPESSDAKTSKQLPAGCFHRRARREPRMTAGSPPRTDFPAQPAAVGRPNQHASTEVDRAAVQIDIPQFPVVIRSR